MSRLWGPQSNTRSTIAPILAPVTGGWDGIASARLVSSSIPGYQLIEYYIILVITAASILAIWYIMKSKVGLAFLAIRENELEARAAGIDPVRYRLLAFALSAYLAGVAGALQIHHIGYLTPELYGVDNSFWPITFVILGGLGTLAGPVVGTVVLTIIWEGLKATGMTFAQIVIAAENRPRMATLAALDLRRYIEKTQKWRGADI